MRVLMGLALVAMLSGCADVSEPLDATTSLEDSDGDGYIDAVEAKYGSDPLNATSVPEVMVHDHIDFADSGLMMFGVENPTATCGGPLGVVSWVWSIAAPADTTKHHVKDLVFTATYPGTMPAGDIFVFGPDGTQLTDSTPDAIPPSPTGATDTVTVDGKGPVGDYTIEVRGCVGSGEIQMAAEGILGYEPSADTLLSDEAMADEHQH